MTNLSKTDLNWIKSNFTKKLSGNGEDIVDASLGEVATDFGQIDFKGATRRARAKVCICIFLNFEQGSTTFNNCHAIVMKVTKL